MGKILIVDDNAAVLDVVSELVASAGFTPITATGGRECLEKVRTDDPDLILLDINMPDLDGWSVLKEKGLTDKIKVMMLTATTDVGTNIFGLQDVVSGYIRKPFNNAELADRLKAVLEQPSESLLETSEQEPRGLLRLFKRGKDAASGGSGMEKATKSAKRYELRRGFGYIVKEQKPVKSFEIFVDQVTHKIQGLCVTRQHPDIIREEWGLEKTPIIWLSNQLGKVYVNPTNISILSDTIIRFVEKSGDSVIILDGIEFLMVNNDFNKVLRMVHHISEAVMEYKSRLIISVDPRALETRELALLERNMEIIDAMEAVPSKPIR